MIKENISRWDKRVITQELNAEWIAQTKHILNHINNYEQKEYKIPLITHSVYFTKTLNHTKLQDLYITKSWICINKFNEVERDFKHYIWTNNLNLDLGQLSQFANLEIRLINEFINHPLYDNIIKLLDEGQVKIRKLVQASDIMRIIVMQKYGGIYHDLDYEIFDAKTIVNYMKSFNYFNGREFDFHDSFIGNAFFASSIDHPIINEMVKLILRNMNEAFDVPEYVSLPQTIIDEILIKTGPVAMTIACYKAMNQKGNIDVIFPAAVFYNAKKVNPNILLSVSNEFNGITLKTLGADMFSGNWNEDEHLNNVSNKYISQHKFVNTSTEKDDLNIKNNYIIENIIKIITVNLSGYFSYLLNLIDLTHYSIKKIFYGNDMINNFEDSLNISKIIDKIYVINLENSHQRWSTVSNSLDKLGIVYERFNAINALDIKVVDQESGAEFTGKALSKNLSLLTYYHKYFIICNPNDPTPFIFNFEHIKVDYPYSIKYLGIMCSNFLIAKTIVENKYQKTIIFEDDIEVESTNFQTKLANYVSHLPETFDLAYLGVYSNKNQQKQINDYVNHFVPEADFFCRMGLIESYKGAEKLLLNEVYWGSFDHYIRAKTVYLKIPNTDLFSLEVYVSSELQDAISITAS